MSGLAIEAVGLVKRFGATTALAGLDLSARPGTTLAVLGPNGSGKTTAVRIMSTLLLPDGGTAYIHGHDVRRRAGQVREMISLTGQYASLDPRLTGFENLVLIARLRELSRRTARRRADDLVDRFGLREAAGRLVRTYSGGMRRRLDLAACMLVPPRVLFLDEPTTGLDPRGRIALWELVQELAGDGVTVLLTTQYLEEADRLADEIAILDRGRVVAVGGPDTLKAKIGGRTVRLRLADPAAREAAARIVAAVTGVTPGRDAGQAGLVVPAAAPHVAPELLRRLDEAGIVPSELTVRLPSLEEVFFTLTGDPEGRP
ncbi:ATP-binding cassette domain-containing protein [Jidongwangia harbinensis]|uniref:ATP-binding cassette domain-containing protein n=1 Tax=Jidongwangia harbinensis TaxID=2878561 RepID=UPI001CDA28B6|nr:ATP-binding cassette domain-containing protein [Jidongwangia harbinensis]MCA2211678.1 ATP-binding cassette domain-containing protein [Jidongwangia harbinensis]